MATNLWTDVEALARLAATARQVENGFPGPSGIEAQIAEWTSGGKPGLEADAIELPARVVSGDFYGAFMVSEGTLAMTIADISGKGVPAGVLRAFASSMVRGACAFSASPADVLTRVNRMLAGARLEAMYVTIFLAWLDLRTGRLRYANAGHPSPFRIPARGAARTLGTATGPILGILDGVSYTEGEEQLDPGDALLLYTDGVTEAQSPTGTFLGARRLHALLGRHASAPVPVLCRLVADTVDRHQRGRRHDDATLLGVRWIGR